MGALQILLHLLLGLLGFIFLLQHRSVGRLPLQVADEVADFPATLQRAQDHQAALVPPALLLARGLRQEPKRLQAELWVWVSSTTLPAGTRDRGSPATPENSALLPRLDATALHKAAHAAKDLPHTSLDSASCQLEQSRWWGSWGRDETSELLKCSVFSEQQASPHHWDPHSPG